MAGGATAVGEVVYTVKIDTKDVKAQFSTVNKTIAAAASDGGADAGEKTGNSFLSKVKSTLGTAAITKVFSTVSSAISDSIGDAISRVDTLNNFPRVMGNLGISADESKKAIDKMAEKLQGLPTTLDAGASAVQRFTSKNNDVAKSTDLFLALNNALLAGGQSTEIQATALEQISQAYAKGRPDMVEWKSIMTAMPAQLNQVAQQMGFGKNGAEALGEAIRNGDVSMDEFMDTIVNLNANGANGFASFEQQAKDSTGGIQTALTVMHSRIVQGVAAVIQEIGPERIAQVATGIGDAIKGVGLVIADIVSFIVDNWAVIGPIIGVIATVAGIIIAINTALTIYKSIQTAVNAVQAAFNLILSANPLGLILTAIAAIIAALTWFFTQTDIGREIISGFCEFVGGAIGAVGEFIGGVLNGIGEFFSNLWNGITNGAKAVWDFITGIFSNLANFFGSIFSAAWNTVKNVFSTGGKIFMGIVDGIANVFKGIVNAIITGINFVVAIPFNAINGFLNTLRSINILGIQPFGWIGQIGVPQIPKLATGGIVSAAPGGHVILAGEAGEDEWVVPESKMASLVDKLNDRGVGGENITINVYGTFATSADEQRKVAEQIWARLQELKKSRMMA